MSAAIGRKRSVIIGHPFRTLWFAIAVILIGLGSWNMIHENNPPVGETATIFGKITVANDIQIKYGDFCTPTAQIIVAGKAYTVHPSTQFDGCKIYVGSRVKVYYDPKNPNRSVIVGNGLFLTTKMIIGGIMIIIPVLISICTGPGTLITKKSGVRSR